MKRLSLTLRHLTRLLIVGTSVFSVSAQADLFTLSANGDNDWAIREGGLRIDAEEAISSAASVADLHGSTAGNLKAGPGTVGVSYGGGYTAPAFQTLRHNPTFLANSRTSVTFHGPGATVTGSLNLHVAGTITVPERWCFGRVVIQLSGPANGGNESVIRPDGTVFFQQQTFPGVTYTVSGRTLTVGGAITTPPFTVATGRPHDFNLRLLVKHECLSDGFSGDVSVSSQFFNTFSFPSDRPVFNLPAGFTASATNLVDNRWTDPFAPQVDLSLGIADTPDPVEGGSEVVYTLTASNLNPPGEPGLDDANDVRIVTGDLPAGASFSGVAATDNWACTEAPLPITCARSAAFEPGQSDSIDLIVRAPVTGEDITLDARVSSAAGDPNPSNNTDSETTLVIAAQDTTPDPFMLDDVFGVERSSSQISNAIIISGINTTTPVAVVGGFYGLNGDVCVQTSGTLEPGDAVQVCHTASDSFGSLVTTTLNVGGVAETFSSTTRLADTTPEPFAFVDQLNVPRNSTRTSNAVSIIGIEIATPVSVVGGAYSISCNGTFTTAAGSISKGQRICVRHESASIFSSEVNTTLTVGGVSDTFTSVTARNALSALLGVTFKVLQGLTGGVLGSLEH